MPDPSAEALPSEIVLIGAGAVGTEIAAAHLNVGCGVRVCDVSREAIERLIADLAARFPLLSVGEAAQLRLGNMHSRKLAVAGDLCSYAFDCVRASSSPTEGFALAIESISENLMAKQALLVDLQAWLGKRAVLCSNTSTIPIHRLTTGLANPQQVCGMHFFMPVLERPLVEIIAPGLADPETLRVAIAHVQRLQKTALTVGDTPGFVVNRILAPYLNEAMRLLERGVAPEVLQDAALAFGMPMSPLELIDLIGTRTAFDAGRVYWQAFPQRLEPASVLAGMVKAKLLGRFAHRGFYRYENQRRSEQLCPEASAVVARYQRGSQSSLTVDQITWQLFLPMLVEAELMLLHAVVASMEEIETAVRAGLGFQRPDGFFYAFERFGAKRIAEELMGRRDQKSLTGFQVVVSRLRAAREKK